MVFATLCNAFAPRFSPRPVSKLVLYETKSESFKVSVAMPPTGSGMQANMAFESILSVPSEIVEVRYKVPFGLNVEPKKGLAVCTQDGEGGEKVGDVLRYASHWTLGLPKGDGLVTQAAAFSGGLSWQCTMFNVMKAKDWSQVVEALLSNEQVSPLLWDSSDAGSMRTGIFNCSPLFEFIMVIESHGRSRSSI